MQCPICQKRTGVPSRPPPSLPFPSLFSPHVVFLSLPFPPLIMEGRGGDMNPHNRNWCVLALNLTSGGNNFNDSFENQVNKLHAL